ncbi:hypothetical protein [Streptomyces variabilis]
MTEREASLIIRMHLALLDEGIGPRPPTGKGTPEDDTAVLAEAVRVAGHLFDEHWDLWESRLISDEVHVPRCDQHGAHE